MQQRWGKPLRFRSQSIKIFPTKILLSLLILEIKFAVYPPRFLDYLAGGEAPGIWQALPRTIIGHSLPPSGRGILAASNKEP